MQMNPSEHKNQQLFTMEYFRLLAEYLPGSTTLNHIRVLQFIGLSSVDGGIGTTHTEICENLALKPTTVTRAIGQFIEAGVIRKRTGFDDSRQRFLMMSLNYPGLGTLDEKVEELAKKHFRASQHFATPAS